MADLVVARLLKTAAPQAGLDADRKEPDFCPAVAFASWMELRKP
jgi:hypothetical protein